MYTLTRTVRYARPVTISNTDISCRNGTVTGMFLGAALSIGTGIKISQNIKFLREHETLLVKYRNDKQYVFTNNDIPFYFHLPGGQYQTYPQMYRVVRFFKSKDDEDVEIGLTVEIKLRLTNPTDDKYNSSVRTVTNNMKLYDLHICHALGDYKIERMVLDVVGLTIEEFNKNDFYDMFKKYEIRHLMISRINNVLKDYSLYASYIKLDEEMFNGKCCYVHE